MTVPETLGEVPKTLGEVPNVALNHLLTLVNSARRNMEENTGVLSTDRYAETYDQGHYETLIVVENWIRELM